jgi:hypothetical protein
VTWIPYTGQALIAFDATTATPTVLAAANASITDDGTGIYTINFARAFDDAGYAFHGSARYNSAFTSPGAHCKMRTKSGAAKTTTTAAVQVSYQGGGFYDSHEVGFVFIGLGGP